MKRQCVCQGCHYLPRGADKFQTLTLINFRLGFIHKFEAEFSGIMICVCQIADGRLRLPIQHSAAQGLLGRGDFINTAEVTVCGLTAFPASVTLMRHMAGELQHDADCQPSPKR